MSLAHARDWAARVGPELRADLGVMADPLRPAGAIGPGTMFVPEWNRIKLLTLRPDLRGRFAEFLARVCRPAFFPMAWDAARTLERQTVLYARGRAGPERRLPRVTWTIASNHLWASAIDVIADGDTMTPEGEPTFALPRWWAREALPLAAKCGLRSLYLATGKDAPHLECRPADRHPRERAWARRLRREFVREWPR
ncbi:MAG: hypothetical protein AABY22_34925 [Nanoarchaeota archaeon]